MQIAKIQKRIVAATIDLVIVFAVSVPLVYFTSLVFPFSGLDGYAQEAIYRSRGMIIGFVVDFVYTIFFMSGAPQATLGMRAMRLKLTKESGGSTELGALFLRYFVSIFSSLFLKLGYIYAVLDSRNQTVHDYVARTIVVDCDGPSFDEVGAKTETKISIPLAGEDDNDKSYTLRILIVLTIILLIAKILFGA
jgi:uncharacterized RDD family membrane protein YckC